MSFEELEQSVITWSNNRGLIHGTTAHHQMVKLQEELGELAGAILKGDHEAMVDGVGDCCVVLINLVEKLKLGGVVWCLENAYDEIKDRKGQMLNGTFVKEADLPTEDDPLTCINCGAKVFNLDYPNDGICPRCMEKLTIGELYAKQRSNIQACKRCEKVVPVGCCDGLCEACRLFYLDECQKDFGLDI